MSSLKTNLIYSTNRMEIYDPFSYKKDKNLIYSFTSQESDEIKYIGQTTNGLKRLKAHFCDSVMNRKCYKNSWIKNVLSKNQKVIVYILVKAENIEQLNKLEKDFINTLGKVHDLTNTLSGGDNFKRIIPYSKETLDKIKKTWENKLQNIEELKKLQLRAKQNLHNPQAKINHLLAMKTYNENLSEKDKQNKKEKFKKNIKDYNEKIKKPIIDQFGTIYSSITEASNILNIKRSNLRKQLKGKTKSNKGYTFLYLDAMVKNDKAQKQDYIDKCLQVKSKYPLPIRSN